MVEDLGKVDLHWKIANVRAERKEVPIAGKVFLVEKKLLQEKAKPSDEYKVSFLKGFKKQIGYTVNLKENKYLR